MLLALVAVWRGEELTAPLWGWNKPGVLTANLPAPAYLNNLADAAEQWFEQQPEDPVTLAKRITEFRLGCTRLIYAEEKPLSAEEKRWLDEQCRLWSESLDNALEAIDARPQPSQVRHNIDEMVRHVARALRTKAEQLEAHGRPSHYASGDDS